jgi:hypothetical protein
VATLRLRIEPEFLAEVVSVGTIDHIRVMRDALGLTLGNAKELVDRCVFGREVVTIEFGSREAAEATAKKLASLPGPAIVLVEVLD